MLISFYITRRTSTILGHLRGLKREENIAKFYSDENGTIAVKCIENNSIHICPMCLTF